MKRRDFVRLSLAVGGMSGFRIPLALAASYAGKLAVFVQADGGWDPTSFCDPKGNVPGEPVINHWAESEEPRQAGNIRYAPFGKNRAFFEKYFQRMLVINGVDAQTNSHEAGIVHNWSGRISEGYPTTTALFAAQRGLGIAMPYLSFGGFSSTSGAVPFTRLTGSDEIRNIARPNLFDGRAEARLVKDKDWETFRRYRAVDVARLATAPNLMPRAKRNRDLYSDAVQPEAIEGLRAFADLLPENHELHDWETFNRSFSSLKRQAELAVLAFKAGVAVSADLFLGGFDTHANHDPDQDWLLGNLTDSIDLLWDHAEIHGIADRLVVVMGSDFGRTNHYNADGGKDHWPIGSFIVMEKNQPWTNRVIGETDELHFAYKVNPATLQRDDANGTLIHPKHVHKALRRYFGIENSLGSQLSPFHNTEDLPLFR